VGEKDSLQKNQALALSQTTPTARNGPRQKKFNPLAPARFRREELGPGPSAM